MFKKSILLFFISSSAIAGAFGPRESKLIFESDKAYIQYRIDNTGKDMPWLVQAWVEDSKEKKQKNLRQLLLSLEWSLHPYSLCE